MRPRLAFFASIATSIFLSCGPSSGQEGVKIGILTDMAGVLSSIDGPGSVIAARMAVEDFGGKVLGKPIEIVEADHQNKADIGSAIARQWFDAEGVDVLADLPNSSVVLAVQSLAKERKKIILVSGAGTPDLSGKACSPTGIHWTWDTYGIARGTATAIQPDRDNSWFFITADYAFGHAIERDAADTVKEKGGKVLGAVRAPFNTPDFSSFLLQAQNSKAEFVALANAGSDAINSIKQAQEFGLTRDGRQKLVALSFFITDAHALGLQAAKDLIFTTAFYWDRDDASRAWSKRFFERHKAMPTMAQAGVYSSLTHYLKAVDVVKTKDSTKVMAKMRETPVQDFFAQGGKVREDGRMVHDLYLMQVKKPGDAKYPWDYYKLVRTIPGDQAFRPLRPSACPLVGPG
jgi:branched-chain amino acid transport system substrate-binding protein